MEKRSKGMMKRISACGIAALVLCIMFCGCGTKKEAEKETGNNDHSEVYVESEFAPLKKVIVAESEQTDSYLPVSECYVSGDDLAAIHGEVRGDIVYLPADQEELKEIAAEREALVSVLEKYGVEVVRPRKLTEKEIALATDLNGPTHGKGMTNMFVRDPFIVMGDNVVESNFRKEYRRYEALTARDYFLGKSNYAGLPMIDVADDEAGPFLEGGDVIVYHNTSL